MWYGNKLEFEFWCYLNLGLNYGLVIYEKWYFDKVVWFYVIILFVIKLIYMVVVKIKWGNKVMFSRVLGIFKVISKWKFLVYVLEEKLLCIRRELFIEKKGKILKRLFYFIWKNKDIFSFM